MKLGKQLKWDDRWAARDPLERKGRLLVAWDQKVNVKQIWSNDFCMELRIGSEEGETDLWVIMVYTSTNIKERQQQWEFLRTRKQHWGTR